MTGQFKSIERGFLATAAIAASIGVLTTTLSSPTSSAARVNDDSSVAVAAQVQVPTTAIPTTAAPTTAVPTTAVPTTAVPTTAVPTTQAPEPITIAEATSIDELATATDFTEEDAHVLRLYTAFFDREADLDGAQFWLGELRNGQSMMDIVMSFSASSEFGTIYASMDDETFIRSAYRHALGREIDQDGFDFWLGELEAGMLREKVFMLFTTGEEYETRS